MTRTRSGGASVAGRRAAEWLRGQPVGLLAAAFGASVVLAAAGCGGSSGDSGTSSDGSGGTGSNPAQSATAAKLEKFAQCMRSHGLPSFPDPVNGRLVLRTGSGSDINPNSAAFQGAQSACQSLAPAGTTGGAPSAQSSGKAVKFGRCMRSHGVPNFPDPKEGSGGTFNLTLPQGVDPQSPQFERAMKACQSLSPLPSGGGAP